MTPSSVLARLGITETEKANKKLVCQVLQEIGFRPNTLCTEPKLWWVKGKHQIRVSTQTIQAYPFIDDLLNIDTETYDFREDGWSIKEVAAAIMEWGKK